MTKRPTAAAQKAAPPATTPVSAPTAKTPKSKFVTVACKIPSGLRLQLQQETTFWEDTPSGAKQRKRFDRVGPVVIVQGPANPVGQAPRGYRRPVIAGGYGLTRNVDREFFEKWMEQNAQAPVVLNRMIFAEDSTQKAADHAREWKDTRSGHEPLQMSADGKSIVDPRVRKAATPGVSDIQTADEFKGNMQADTEEFTDADV